MVFNLKKWAVSLTSVLVLAGCSTQQAEQRPAEDLRSNDSEEMTFAPAASKFDRHLYTGYSRQARREDREHDFADSEAFLSRATRSARGELVEPEYLNARRIPAHAVQELRIARDRLEKAFYQGASVRHPESSAHAQVMFDCWMEQQEEDIQHYHIEECKSAFYKALAKIEPQTPAVPQSLPLQPGGNYCGCCCQPGIAKPAVNTKRHGPYLVLFDLDSAELDEAALGTIERVKADYMKWKANRVVISGHTDSSGTNRYNEGLSKRRVNAVELGLRLAGVSQTHFDDSHFGETRLKVPTGDGVRKRANRRVEIFLEWK
ncbi:OmpA family protein [Marinobacterium jannaschii]|uniref:OmpA family protein n=1 Tax=Marinobacterium jannaschii TaxID=64970 RepID=UPI000484673D|nr:OmpA family protein [Marinobacterium jannaschii]